MFSLHDIDDRIAMFNATAVEAEARASCEHHPAASASFFAAAFAYRECAKSLERMVADEVEREAREALR